jgi:large subunit ribosomal protein L23
MAFFRSRKKEEEKAEQKPAARPSQGDTVKIPQDVASKPSGSPSGAGRDVSRVLKHARITEKATMQQGAGVYTFDVAPGATKRDIFAAIRALYNVAPVKVAIGTVPSKTRHSMRTGKRGVSAGGKKAYVYLKKGETIEVA